MRALLLLAASALPAGAQSPPATPPREQVVRAIAALGGEPLLRSLVSLQVDAVGTIDRMAQMQGASAQSYVEFEQVPAGDNPPTATVAEGIIQKIKAAVPGKPIRYVTVSHYHNDHAGGVRPFWAEGATLLTTPGTWTYFERYGQRPVTVAPDRLAALGPAAPRAVETIAGTRVITDGERTVEVISVGPTLHTAEALVVYFSKERIIYQGDQFYFDNDASFPPRERLPVMGEFARWIQASGRVVERVRHPHHRVRLPPASGHHHGTARQSLTTVM